MACEEAGVFDEEAASERGVGVEGDLELAEKREEVGFDESRDRVVVALINGGERIGIFFTDVVDFLHIWWSEVGEAELRCVLDGERGGVAGGVTYVTEFPSFVDDVDSFEGLFDWSCYVWCVKVVDFDLN